MKVEGIVEQPQDVLRQIEWDSPGFVGSEMDPSTGTVKDNRIDNKRQAAIDLEIAKDTWIDENDMSNPGANVAEGG